MSCSCDSSLIGLGLFAAVPVMFHVFLRRTNFCRLSTRSRQPSIKGASVRQLISQAEEIVQRDEGGRGIKDIFLPPGELFKSAEEMLKAKNIVIVTGFPCLIDYTPPTETDGPLGAAAIAYTLLRLGKRVTILTDTCNEEVMLSCCASADFSSERFALESFPPLGEFDSRDYKRLARFSDPDGSEECPDVDLFIAIERTGPNYEGAYRTMRNRDMSHLIAPLENILPYNDDLSPFPKARTLRSIGIGKSIPCIPCLLFICDWQAMEEMKWVWVRSMVRCWAARLATRRRLLVWFPLTTSSLPLCLTGEDMPCVLRRQCCTQPESKTLATMRLVCLFLVDFGAGF